MKQSVTARKHHDATCEMRRAKPRTWLTPSRAPQPRKPEMRQVTSGQDPPSLLHLIPNLLFLDCYTSSVYNVNGKVKVKITTL